MWAMAIPAAMEAVEGLSKMGGSGDDDSQQGVAGESYLNQISPILKKYYAPYSHMLQDPTGELKILGSGYTQSPGYQFELGQAQQAGTRAAAAGGMAGSPMQQQQAQQTASGFASQDYYKYLENAMNMYQTGAKGYAGLGENLSNVLLSQSKLAQLQQEEQERAEAQSQAQSSGLFGAGLGGMTSIFGKMLGKGGASGAASAGAASGGGA